MLLGRWSHAQVAIKVLRPKTLHPAQVLLGRWRHALVAVKVLREECTQHAGSAALADFRREAELLQSMRHPYILNFLGACFDRKPVRARGIDGSRTPGWACLRHPCGSCMGRRRGRG